MFIEIYNFTSQFINMKSKLSQSFYGCKKFLSPHFQALKTSKTITNQQVKQIFQPYTSMLSSVRSQDGTCTLLEIFAQFIRGNAIKFFNWPVEKLSTWIQISAHVFEYSFENHLNKKQSFEYFSQVLVRHSLFRPPHSVNIFQYQQSKQIMNYWINTFIRFYEQYRQCFQAQLNQIIYTVAPSFAPCQAQTSEKKEMSREDFAAKFGQKLGVNLLPQKSI